MYTLAVFIPLISCIIAGLMGRLIGIRGAQTLTTTLIGITALLWWIILYEVGYNNSEVHILLGTWISSEALMIEWGLLYDKITVTMGVVVSTISWLVHMYSIDYMKGDPHIQRFMSKLSLFTFFMLILVSADNIVQMFIGWEGVGLSSYLLIGFWYTRIQASKAAVKAIIVNRIGDYSITIGIVSMFALYKAVDYSTIIGLTPYMNHIELVHGITLVNIIAALMLIGAVGKSAQIGLHTWLPDAMEGPTPVSALIHAATMVTAGVYLMIRLSGILEYAPEVLMWLAFIGALTALMAGSIGLVQTDIKKVIAYSTCSQLGYMMMACGLSGYNISIMHLTNHAVFKALLFLSAGSVIHAVSDEQDMRRLGALRYTIPLTYTLMLIGSMALMGVPYLTGYYSKDMIIELGLGSYSINGAVVYWLGTITAAITAYYSMRLLYMTFISIPQGLRHYLYTAHEAPTFMLLPMLILGLLSVFTGYMTKELMCGVGTNYWGQSILILPDHNRLLESEYIQHLNKVLPVIGSMLGAILGILLEYALGSTLITIKRSALGMPIYSFLINKWYFDKIYNDLIVKPLLEAGYNITFKALDRGIIEVLGPYGLRLTVDRYKDVLRSLQGGNIYQYTLVMFLTIIGCTTIVFMEYIDLAALTALMILGLPYIRNNDRI